MKNFRMTLSRKLTFFIMGLLLIIWLTFGGVLVFTTAQNILTDSYTEAHSISQRYRYDSFTNAYTPPKDDWWIQHAHQTGFTGIIHPATNRPGSPIRSTPLSTRTGRSQPPPLSASGCKTTISSPPAG